MKKIMIMIFALLISDLLCAQNGTKINSINGVPLKDFYFVMLTKSPNAIQDSAAEAKLISGHITNLFRLKKMGKLVLAGPFTDQGKWYGMFFFACRTLKEVVGYLKTDPAIAAGWLDYEIHPWRTLQNCLFN